jgi:hypothetical protein
MPQPVACTSLPRPPAKGPAQHSPAIALAERLKMLLGRPSGPAALRRDNAAVGPKRRRAVAAQPDVSATVPSSSSEGAAARAALQRSLDLTPAHKAAPDFEYVAVAFRSQPRRPRLARQPQRRPKQSKEDSQQKASVVDSLFGGQAQDGYRTMEMFSGAPHLRGLFMAEPTEETAQPSSPHAPPASTQSSRSSSSPAAAASSSAPAAHPASSSRQRARLPQPPWSSTSIPGAAHALLGASGAAPAPQLRSVADAQPSALLVGSRRTAAGPRPSSAPSAGANSSPVAALASAFSSEDAQPSSSSQSRPWRSHSARAPSLAEAGPRPDMRAQCRGEADGEAEASSRPTQSREELAMRAAAEELLGVSWAG